MTDVERIAGGPVMWMYTYAPDPTCSPEFHKRSFRDAYGPNWIETPLYPQNSQDARALEGYRAAVSFIGADSWDGCPDCIEILRAARMADHDWHWTPDETAESLKRLRAHLEGRPR